MWTFHYLHAVAHSILAGQSARAGAESGVLTGATFKSDLPRVGDKTEGRMFLSEYPSLASPPEVKFAAFTDSRMQDPSLYRRFVPFIPREIQLSGPPIQQSCFAAAFDLPGTMDRFGFDQALAHRGFQRVEGCLGSQSALRPGDLIAYYRFDPDNGFDHVGVYLGEGRVRSRWGVGAPLVDHPIGEVPPIYMSPEIGDFMVFRAPAGR